MLVWPQRPLLFFFPPWHSPSVKGDCWLSISRELHKAKVQQHCREWGRSMAHRHLPESAVWAELSLTLSRPVWQYCTPLPSLWWQTSEVGEVKSQSEFRQIGLEQFRKTASCATLFHFVPRTVTPFKCTWESQNPRVAPLLHHIFKSEAKCWCSQTKTDSSLNN